MSKKSERTQEASKTKVTIRAKKDFHLFCPRKVNPVDIDIKKGDDVNDVPKEFFENLKTEGVI